MRRSNNTPRLAFIPLQLASYPQRLPELIYPSYMQTRRVSHNGVIYWNAWQIYIGYLLAGEEIGIEPIGDGLWQIHSADQSSSV